MCAHHAMQPWDDAALWAARRGSRGLNTLLRRSSSECYSGDTTVCTNKRLIPAIRSLVKAYSEWRRVPEGEFVFDGRILDEYASEHFVKDHVFNDETKAVRVHPPRARDDPGSNTAYLGPGNRRVL